MVSSLLSNPISGVPPGRVLERERPYLRGRTSRCNSEMAFFFLRKPETFSDACPHVVPFVTQNDLPDAMPDTRNSFAHTKTPELLRRAGFLACLARKGNDL